MIDRQVIALEVTTAADGDVTAMWEEVAKRDWLEPSLGSSWGLTLETGARIKKLKKDVAGRSEFLKLPECSGSASDIREGVSRKQ